MRDNFLQAILMAITLITINGCKSIGSDTSIVSVAANNGLNYDQLRIEASKVTSGSKTMVFNRIFDKGNGDKKQIQLEVGATYYFRLAYLLHGKIVYDSESCKQESHIKSRTHGPLKAHENPVSIYICPTSQGTEVASHKLCIFDYDLTLSSHACSRTQTAHHFCRKNSVRTYNWYDQCIGVAARAAIAKCVAEQAYIGIVSHAALNTFNDKIRPLVSLNQFPELFNSPNYNNPNSKINYPKLDDTHNWNCATCAYHLNNGGSKSRDIAKVMTHYGLSPSKDQGKVIFWDDTPNNINHVKQALPGIHTITVSRNGSSGNDGGCGIEQSDITKGWQAVSGH